MAGFSDVDLIVSRVSILRDVTGTLMVIKKMKCN